jgi:hypothetical protein
VGPRQLHCTVEGLHLFAQSGLDPHAEWSHHLDQRPRTSQLGPGRLGRPHRLRWCGWPRDGRQVTSQPPRSSPAGHLGGGETEFSPDQVSSRPFFDTASPSSDLTDFEQTSNGYGLVSGDPRRHHSIRRPTCSVSRRAQKMDQDQDGGTRLDHMSAGGRSPTRLTPCLLRG